MFLSSILLFLLSIVLLSWESLNFSFLLLLECFGFIYRNFYCYLTLESYGMFNCIYFASRIEGLDLLSVSHFFQVLLFFPLKFISIYLGYFQYLIFLMYSQTYSFKYTYYLIHLWETAFFYFWYFNTDSIKFKKDFFHVLQLFQWIGHFR
jgi:hypothetical protein